MKICSECRSPRFGLIRYRWDLHQFCRKECLDRFRRRVDAEAKHKRFLTWLSGDASRQTASAAEPGWCRL
jgi:hypothetical protein